MTELTLTEPTLLRRLTQTAAARSIEPEVLLNQAVRQFLDQLPKEESRKTKNLGNTEASDVTVPPEFLREMSAFERLKPELLKQYRGRVVAIYKEQVVAVGDDEMVVYGDVLDRLGYVPCYVDRVVEEQRVLRMPSIRVVQ